MRVISLNCYFAHEFNNLTKFLIDNAPTTDVFCLQEILSNPREDITTLSYRGRANFLQELTRLLPAFHVYFAPMQDDFDFTPEYPGQLQLGIVVAYTTSLPVSDVGHFFVHRDLNTYDGKDYATLGHNAVHVAIDGSTPLTIVSLHGNSQPSHKRDSKERIQQSQRVLDFLSTTSGAKIVMGDFNLLPDTESVRMFERAGFRNLITEYGITTTRGSNLRKLFPEYANSTYGFQEFADYTFISPEISVQHFEVPDLALSDHLPMLLTFEVATP